jgi:hypothetical protein
MSMTRISKRATDMKSTWSRLILKGKKEKRIKAPIMGGIMGAYSIHTQTECYLTSFHVFSAVPAAPETKRPPIDNRSIRIDYR